MLAAAIVYILWHSWGFSIIASIIVYMAGWKFGAKRPFTNGISKE